MCIIQMGENKANDNFSFHLLMTKYAKKLFVTFDM